ncbi:23S rRNA (guanine745-N1)-methyltransferase [Agromyces sp. 3263]|nr:methyltransferase domain-containing protein [Agromyces sp. 3263]MDR6907220.1 23S rRNA (guanine745-N1)-methyltransferase [Agromyces sp. 3263]
MTLLPPRAPRTLGDDREMLAARASLLDGGAYSPISDAVIEAGRVDSTVSSDPSMRIADLACGTGYYSGALARSVPSARLLLADRSPDAVRMSLRSTPDATGIVLDLWSPLPIRDGVVDVALNVFGPRNPAEFARVLAPHGRLVVVVPRPGHLAELRRDGQMLDVPAGKAEQVVNQFAPHGLGLTVSTTIEYALRTDPPMRRLLVGMGPSARHATTSTTTDAGLDQPIDVTISVDILVFGRTTASTG